MPPLEHLVMLASLLTASFAFEGEMTWSIGLLIRSSALTVTRKA